MDCAAIMRSYSRYLLIIFNLIFSLTGIVIISVGISAKAYFHEYNTFLDNKYFYISDLLIVIGVIIFFIAFFGCCGAMKENACMTSTFSTLLIIIFVLEVMVGVAGFMLKNRTEEFLVDKLDNTMISYGNDTEITQVWDTVQTKLHCCGVINATDWKEKTNATNGEVPMSCCHVPAGTHGEFDCNFQNAYHEGCLSRLGDYIRENIEYIQGVGIGLAVIQFLGIILSCYLSKSIRSDYETV